MRLSFLLLSLVVLIGLSLARRDFDGAPPGLGGGFIPPGQAKKMAKFGGMGDGGFGGRGAGPPGESFGEELGREGGGNSEYAGGRYGGQQYGRGQGGYGYGG